MSSLAWAQHVREGGHGDIGPLVVQGHQWEIARSVLAVGEAAPTQEATRCVKP
jgi:hypothetical protein